MNIIEFFVKLINVIILTLYAKANDKKKNDHHSVNDDQVFTFNDDHDEDDHDDHQFLPWAPLLAAYCEELYHVQYHEPAKVNFNFISLLEQDSFCIFHLSLVSLQLFL